MIHRRAPGVGIQRMGAAQTVSGVASTLWCVRIYVAAPLAAVALVESVHRQLLEAGHELTLDWTRDMSMVAQFASQPVRSAHMASGMIRGIQAADAVLVLATEHDGRGMFVELGAALAEAERGSLDHIAVIGTILRESVFYFHPLVRRCETLQEWLAQPAGA